MKRFLLLLSGVIIYAACRLLINQQELLYAAQDMLIWRDDWVFLSEMMHHPYAIIDSISRILTSEFYHPWVGIVILLCCWIAASMFSYHALQPGKVLCFFCVLPIFCLLSSIIQMGYWIYFLKFPSYWFFFSLLWLWWSLMLMVWFRVRRRSLQILLVCILLVILTPWNGLQIQLFKSTDNDFVLRPLLAIPWILAVQLASHLIQTKLTTKIWPARLTLTVGILAIGAGVVWSTMLDYANERFSTDLKSLRLAEAGDWNGIIELSGNMKQTPSRQFVLLRDAALLHTDQLRKDSLSASDTAFLQKYALSNPCEGKIPKMRNAPQVYMAFSGGPMVYLCFGFINDAYRWTFEYGIENGLTTQRIRMLLTCALLNEEWDLCRRYIRLLRHIPHQSEYADRAEQLIGHPERMKESPLLASVDKIRQTKNKLRFDDSHVETILLTDSDSPIIEHRKWHILGQTKVSTY